MQEAPAARDVNVAKEQEADTLRQELAATKADLTNAEQEGRAAQQVGELS